MDVLKKINEWVQKGLEINCFSVNQIENGYGDDVLKGNIPKYTYTFVISENEEQLWSRSVNSLEEGFSLAVNWLEDNRG